MFKYFNRKPTGKYRIIKKWYGCKVEVLCWCDVYWDYAYIGKDKYWFKATKKDIKRINKKLK